MGYRSEDSRRELALIGLPAKKYSSHRHADIFPEFPMKTSLPALYSLHRRPITRLRADKSILEQPI